MSDCDGFPAHVGRGDPVTRARSEAAIPEFEQRLKTGLERLEPEPVARAHARATVVALDERLDAPAGFPGRARHPAGKVHVVLRFEPLQFACEILQVTLDSSLLGHVVGEPGRNDAIGQS